MIQFLRQLCIFPVFLAIFAISVPALSVAQEQSRPQIGCIDADTRQQAQFIKDHYTNQGFKVFRDAMLTMESIIAYPVVAQLHASDLYVIGFVATQNANKLKLEIYDGGDSKLEEILMMRNRDQPNYILHTFSPDRSDNFLFVMSQKYKNKTVCGNFFILKLDKMPEGGIIPYSNK